MSVRPEIVSHTPCANISRMAFVIWFRMALAVGFAYAAALAFYPALRLNRGGRTLSWLLLSSAIALSPCVIPLTARPLRLLASLVAITLLVKLFDAFQAFRLALRLGFLPYAVYLPNGFWLVLRREPSRPPAAHDLRRLLITAPAAAAWVVLCVGLFRLDWARVPFAIEHAVKAPAAFVAVVLIGRTAAAAWRLLGGSCGKGRGLRPRVPRW